LQNLLQKCNKPSLLLQMLLQMLLQNLLLNCNKQARNQLHIRREEVKKKKLPNLHHPRP
jgi:hypothetical protein